MSVFVTDDKDPAKKHFLQNTVYEPPVVLQFFLSPKEYEKNEKFNESFTHKFGNVMDMWKQPDMSPFS